MQAEELHKVFRRNLRTVRLEAGLTQVDVAKRMRVDQGYISDLETGRRKPNLGTLGPLADALGIAPATLISTAVLAESAPEAV